MDRSCLRIKFTPLLQNLQKDNSNHCLEIVPEVTCIQNLDKIQWYKEENSIEYTIPMTYKVILKKRVVSKKDDLSKTYYSCVDLLVPPALSDTNLTQLGSGDIKRIVSDTFVLTNVTADVEKCSIILKEHYERNTLDSDINQQIPEAQINIKRDTSSTYQCSAVDTPKCLETPKASSATPTTSAVIHSKSHVIQVSDVDVTRCLKKTHDQITITNVIHDVETNIKPKRNIPNVFTMKSKIDTKYKLSITPICFIDTDDNNFNSHTNIVPSDSYLYRGNDSLKDIEEIDYTVANFQAPNSCEIFNMKTGCKHYNLISTVPQFEYSIRHRILPEVRVADFVQQMEKEINPLKIMLSEIINKCSRLGYNKNKLHNPVLYKSVKNCDMQINKTWCKSNIKDQTKSNRVVYSFVFDG